MNIMNNNIINTDNIDELIKISIDKLKSQYKLPNNGLIAGGALANTAWSIVKGNEPTINDIDIFKKNRSDVQFIKPNNDYKMPYTYMSKYNFITDYIESINMKYNIIDVIYDGIYNIIYTDVTDNKYENIIKSFDLNCVQVGYSLEEGNTYYSNEFIEFLNTGDLKIVNLNNPIKTLIRLFKKKDELHLNDFKQSEIDICKYSILGKNIYKIDNKYYKLYEKFKDVKKHIKIENYTSIKDKYLVKIINHENFIENVIKFNRMHINNDIIFFFRNIYKNNKKEFLWNNVKKYIMNIDNYMDCDYSIDDINVISDIRKFDKYKVFEKIKLSEQIKFINKLKSEFNDIDIIKILISKFKITNEMIFDELTKMMIDISIRNDLYNLKNSINITTYEE